jgi:hypothetical protein
VQQVSVSKCQYSDPILSDNFSLFPLIRRLLRIIAVKRYQFILQANSCAIYSAGYYNELNYELREAHYRKLQNISLF